MTHPLTNDICHRISEIWPPDAAERNMMRSAADWQLEQVLKWLNETIFERGCHLEAENIPEELAEAMRPTTTQENN